MSETQPESQPKGLSIEHHQELNSFLPDKDKNERCEDLRVHYHDSPLALYQIDRYDPKSEYRRKIYESNKAYEEKDCGKITELEAWFRAHEEKHGIKQA